MSDRSLGQVLAAFDDAALETMASRGLLRRARRDVEQELADIIELTGDRAVVQADGEAVHIDATGPAHAKCSCPAAGICRHVLAAVLVIQAGAEGAPLQAGETPDSGAEPDAEPGHDSAGAAAGDAGPVAEITGLSQAEIEKWAGKAAMRAAREWLAENGAADIRLDGAAIVVTLASDTPEIRYLAGLGLDGMVSRVSKARRKALHAAAILAVRQAEGLAIDAAEPRGPAASPPSAPPDADFMNAVERCLADCVRTGFNKAPRVLEERLFALSVATRADALPRLSRQLRSISAMVRAKRERNFALDVDRYLSLVAETHMLIRALRAQDSGTGRLEALAGRVRQDYAPVGTLDLFGAGARIWHTASGARGVTGYFYDPRNDAWFSASLARNSGQDPGFRPTHAYRTESLWTTGSLETLSRSRLTLHDAGVSSDRRLSLAATVKCRCAPWPVAAGTVTGWPACADNWTALGTRLTEHFAPALAGGQTAPCPVVLAPARHAMAYFDEVAQETVWPVRDAEGAWIALTLPHGLGGDDLARHLESLARSRSVWAISVLVEPEGSRFVLRPFAVWTGEGDHALFNLGLDERSMQRSRPVSGRDRLRGLFRRAAVATGMAGGRFRRVTPDSATPRTLRDGVDACLAVAELGRRDLEPELRQRLEILAERAGRIGLAPCEDALAGFAGADGPDVPGRLLHAVYVVNSLQALLRPLPWLVPSAD